MNPYDDIEIWADAYIRVQDAGASLDESHPDYLAAYEFMEKLSGERAEKCWQGILAVVARRPSEHVLGVLAAGLLEDLLDDSGPQFIERIEEQAQRDPIFKHMLTGVWRSGSPIVWSKLEAARDNAS